MNTVSPDFDAELEDAAAQAKRGVLFGLTGALSVMLMLWGIFGNGALYFCAAAALIGVLMILRSIADGYADLSDDGFDFDYGIKTN